jgi:hypothetical protein
MTEARQEDVFARIYGAFQDGDYKKVVKCADSGARQIVCLDYCSSGEQRSQVPSLGDHHVPGIFRPYIQLNSIA